MSSDFSNLSTSSGTGDAKIDEWRCLSVLMIEHARENADHAVNILKVLMETTDAQTIQSIYERETALLADRIVAQLDELTRVLPIEGNLLLRQLPSVVPPDVSPPIVSFPGASLKGPGSDTASKRTRSK